MRPWGKNELAEVAAARLAGYTVGCPSEARRGGAVRLGDLADSPRLDGSGAPAWSDARRRA